MLKNIAIATAVVVTAAIAYVGVRKFKKDSPADLAKLAVDAVSQAIENTKKDLADQSSEISLSQLFSVNHDDAEKIKYDQSWSNGTGYFDGAVKVELAPGKTAAAVADDGRRILLIGHETGTIVLFERYTSGHGPFVVVHNTPKKLREEIPSGNLSAVQLAEIVVKYIK